MKCPICGETMEVGQLTYRSGFRESVLGGSSAFREVYFLPDDVSRTEILAVVLTDSLRPGHRCTACGAVLLTGSNSPKP
ncbi:MAG: PF20097 family protein [Planctomycetes bacterium]|nr:PF20097 family protein [Planctomycetota bacterium]